MTEFVHIFRQVEIGMPLLKIYVVSVGIDFGVECVWCEGDLVSK